MKGAHYGGVVGGAVPLPERNSGLVVDCRFQQDRAHATQDQISFALREQCRANTLSAMRFRDI
jgi:hypothetical protein